MLQLAHIPLLHRFAKIARSDRGEGMRNSLQLRHFERDDVSNHQPHDCLLNRIFRRRSEKTPKLRVTGLCAGNLPMTGESPAQSQ